MAWKNLEPLPAARKNATAASWRNWVYILGGNDGAVSPTDALTVKKTRVNAIDDGSEPWTECAPPMTSGKNGATLLVHPNGYLIVLGGIGVSAVSAMETAQTVLVGKIDSDGNVPRWTTAGLPSGLSDFAACVIEDYIYLFGGLDIKVRVNFGSQSVNKFLKYKTQTGNFTVGQVVTGTTSTATGTIVADVDGGATGTLELSGVVGTFVDGEALTDPITGAALVNGTLFDHNFIVGETVTGGTSSATGIVYTNNDSGATGSLIMTNVVGTFVTGETLTGSVHGLATSTSGAVAYNLVQTKVWRARIEDSGSALGTWVLCAATLPSLVAGYGFQGAVAVAGKRVFLGLDDGVSANLIYTAKVDETKELGPWSTIVSPVLTTTVPNLWIVQGDYLVVMGDTESFSARFNSDGVVGKWTPCTPMAHALSGISAGARTQIGNRLFVIGGDDGVTDALTLVQVVRVDPSGSF